MLPGDICWRVLLLRDHGRKPDDMMFWNTNVAYKYKMSSLQPALILGNARYPLIHLNQGSMSSRAAAKHRCF